jgi:hypothetical protein
MDTQAPRLIAFAGPAGVGKSEASKLLTDRGFVPVKFAEGLKSMIATVYELCGLDEDEIKARLEGDLKEKPDRYLRGVSPRRAMQTLGTEWGRDCVAEDLWVSIWQRRVELQLKAGLSVVTDDLRHTNEAAAVRSLGGEVVKLEGVTRRTVPSHSSEAFNFDPDAVVRNNVPLEVFWDRILTTLNLT